MSNKKEKKVKKPKSSKKATRSGKTGSKKTKEKKDKKAKSQKETARSNKIGFREKKKKTDKVSLRERRKNKVKSKVEGEGHTGLAPALAGRKKLHFLRYSIKEQVFFAKRMSLRWEDLSPPHRSR